eukprot:scaffold146_cov374-Prasinococcus_capsulatus_cf.AAC.19
MGDGRVRSGYVSCESSVRAFLVVVAADAAAAARSASMAMGVQLPAGISLKDAYSCAGNPAEGRSGVSSCCGLGALGFPVATPPTPPDATVSKGDGRASVNMPESRRLMHCCPWPCLVNAPRRCCPVSARRCRHRAPDASSPLVAQMRAASMTAALRGPGWRRAAAPARKFHCAAGFRRRPPRVLAIGGPWRHPTGVRTTSDGLLRWAWLSYGRHPACWMARLASAPSVEGVAWRPVWAEPRREGSRFADLSGRRTWVIRASRSWWLAHYPLGSRGMHPPPVPAAAARSRRAPAAARRRQCCAAGQSLPHPAALAQERLTPGGADAANLAPHARQLVAPASDDLRQVEAVTACRPSACKRVQLLQPRGIDRSSGGAASEDVPKRPGALVALGAKVRQLLPLRAHLGRPHVQLSGALFVVGHGHAQLLRLQPELRGGLRELTVLAHELSRLCFPRLMRRLRVGQLTQEPRPLLTEVREQHAPVEDGRLGAGNWGSAAARPLRRRNLPRLGRKLGLQLPLQGERGELEEQVHKARATARLQRARLHATLRQLTVARHILQRARGDLTELAALLAVVDRP